MPSAPALPTPEEFLQGYPIPQRALAQGLRQLVRETLPEVREAVVPGWKLIGYRVPDGKKGVYLGYLSLRADGVYLGFERGVDLPDPRGLLEGPGVQVRNVVVRSPDDLDHVAIAELLRAAEGHARARIEARSKR